MPVQALYETFRRYRTLQTHRISSLPVVILMPHSACNCRCVMCDIWKANQHLQQLTESDVSGLISSLKKFGTKQVVFSGGEALLNPNFFKFCEILKKEDLKITLLSTGLTLKKNARQLVDMIDDIIVSLDGNEMLHNSIRNIPNAYQKMAEGIQEIRNIDPAFKISGRTVIHRMNFRYWQDIVESAKSLGLDQISFLPADVSSSAFNREIIWDESRQHELLLAETELAEMKCIIDEMRVEYNDLFESRFIAESPEKLEKIYYHYSAFYGNNLFPFKKCNAPWVSTVVEADGTVRPCFFHEAIGNIKSESFDKIINSDNAIEFRRHLDMDKNETCLKCVCYLNLKPGVKV